MTAELIIFGPEGRRQTVALSRDRITLGRLISNDLAYPDDPGLSRHHVAFEWQKGAWYVHDLGSKNGTVLNGKRIQDAQRLTAGDRILAGRVVLEFRDAEETVVYGAEESSTSTTVFTDLRSALVAGERSTRLHVLLAAGRELAGDRSLDDLLGIILRLALQAVGATRGSIEIAENGRLVNRATVGAAFEISRTVRESVMNGRTSMLVADAGDDELLNNKQSIVVQRVCSLLAVPLQTSDKVIGIVYLDAPESLKKFSPDDLNLLTVLANVAAVRIEQARMAGVEQQVHAMSADLDEAAKIQRRLLPASVPDAGGLDLCGYNQSCQGVGGDYYDFLTLSGGCLGLVLADVSGKGMAAALLMSSLHARVRLLAEREDNPAVLVEELNRHVHASSPVNRFITLFMMVVDPITGRYLYSNAGHNPPLIVRASGSVERLDVGGLILGFLPQAKYDVTEGRLLPGDVLVIFSDGVTEAPRPGTDDEFGEDRLEEVVVRHRESGAAEIQSAVVQALGKWTGDGGAADDVTIVVARRPSVPRTVSSTPTGG